MSDFAAALAKAKVIAASLGTNKRSADDSDPSFNSEESKRSIIYQPSRYAGVANVAKLQNQIMSAPIQDPRKREFYFPKNYVGSVIGRAGENLRKIEGDCRCKVQVEHSDVGEFRLCCVSGDGGDLLRAQAMVDEICNYEIGASLGKVVEYKYPVPLSKVSTVRDNTLQVQKLTGVTMQMMEHADDFRTKSRPCVIVGSAMQVTDARKQIEELCGGNSNTRQLYIVNDRVGLVIGRGGEGIKNIMATCNVKIQIEQQPGPQGRLVTITGNDEDIDNAKWMIDEKIGPMNRSRYVQDYNGDGGGTEDPTENYGYSGEDPYKDQLMTQQQYGYTAGFGAHVAAGGAQDYAAPEVEAYATAGADGYAADASYYQDPATGQWYQYAATTEATVAESAPGGGDEAADYAAWYAYYYPNGVPAEGTDAAAEYQSQRAAE